MIEHHRPPLLAEDEFIGIAGTTFLYTGAHSPAFRPAEEAIRAAYRQKSRGVDGRDVLFAAEEHTRASIGRLAGHPGADVGLLGDASTAWSAIANGWTWKPGDNVVINEYEHPAVFAPFLRLRRFGLEVRVAPKDDDWGMTPDRILELCDERTVAVGLSHVGYVTGLRHDLGVIGRALDSAGIPLLVDVSHSLGVVDVDLSYASLTVCASYKWLLGPYGVGAVIWNQERLPDFQPGAVGWRSLEDMFTDSRFDEIVWNADGARFQMGAPAFSEIAGLGAGADAISGLGIANVEAHALALGESAIRGLESLGLDVLTPTAAGQRAGNVAFAHPDGEAMSRRLAEENILVWGGDGRVRASFHVMNGSDDVQRMIDAVAADIASHPVRSEVSV